MSKVCLDWSLEDLCEMNEEDMDVLLQSYALHEVPKLAEIRGSEEFDGSYGWSCVI